MSKRAAPSSLQGNSEKKNCTQVSRHDSGGAPVVETCGSGYRYISGHGNYISSEAKAGTLPVGQNTPQQCAHGLFAEQLSGTSFTTPRVHLKRSWLYRIRPSCVHKPFKPYKGNPRLVSDFSKAVIDPNQIRWDPYPMPASDKKVDFVHGLSTLCGAGSVESKSGVAIHIYAFNADMEHSAFVNADGDMLIVPQQGTLRVQTEFGVMRVEPQEICVVQRGVRFAVSQDHGSAEQKDHKSPGCRGYICEVFTSHFRIPDLGPIGANGLANTRDFLSPVAHYENKKYPGHTFTLLQKYGGSLFSAAHDRTVFDVVGWHGNYVPYKYDLRRFCVINSVSFDHLDPSIFTVLTAPTNEVGVAALDFVIFPPRFAVQQHTFRPPYYHRNCMSEFMGNICGKYEAKPDGFRPGGGSLHSCMVGHGPDAATYKKCSTEKLEPVRLPENALAFMFESTYIFRMTPWAYEVSHDDKYHECWEGLPQEFDEPEETVHIKK